MRRAVVLTFVALGAAGLWLGRGPRPRQPARIVPAPARADVVARDVPPGAVGGRPSDVVPLDAAPRPRSLRGTRVDGGLAVDADGRFLPTRDARRLFDYFLTATGEATDAEVRTRIEREIARRLPPDAAREAGRLLERY